MRAGGRSWVALLCITAAACGREQPARENAGAHDGLMVVSAEVVGTPVATLTVEVTAPDIAVALVFNLTVNAGRAEGTLRLPPGDGRLVVVRAFDSFGTITHEGSVTIDVRAGVNPALRVPMRPAAGQVQISVQLGPVTIQLYSSAAPLDPGETEWVAAYAYDPAGLEVLDCIEWATSDPTVLDVRPNEWDSRSAQMTAVAPGTALLVATCAGVARTVTVTVNPWLVAGNSTALAGAFPFCLPGDLVFALPVALSTPMTLRQLAYLSPQAGDSMRLALYRDEAGAPGALVAGTDFAPVAEGENALPVPATDLAAGDYWFALEGRGYTSRGACLQAAPAAVSTTYASANSPGSSPWPDTLSAYVGTWSTDFNVFLEGQPAPAP